MSADLADHRWIQFVLRNLNAGMKAFGSVVRQNWYLALRDDFAVINFLIDMVHRATCHFFPGRECL